MEPHPPRFTVSVAEATATEGSAAPAIVHKRGVDLRSTELLRHECEVLGRIRHPGIVELVPRSDAAGPPTLSTYLAGNVTLADHPPTRTDTIARTGAQIATTLAELHDTGTTHGAIAPDHCVLGPGGSVVLCSLRAARSISGGEHPAALRDVADLVGLLRSWQGASSSRRDRTSSRLESVVAAAERRTPSARDLATALSELDPAAVHAVRRERHRSSPATSQRSRPPRAATRPGAWRAVGALAVALAAGLVIGQLDLVADPGGAAGGLPPAVWATAVALRWLALGACGYLALVAAVTLAATLTRDERLERAAERLAPGRVRRWAAGATSIGMLGSAVASSVAVEHPATSSHPAPDPWADPTSTSTVTASTTTTTPAAIPSAPSVQSAPLLATPVGPAAPTTWTVRRGDHLWSIAERTVHDRLGRPAAEAEVQRYWSAVISANRERLADPSNPDLIFAGQVFVLPPID